MGMLDKLTSKAAGLAGQLKTAAKQELRGAVLPELIMKKSLQLAGLDKELGKLPWSADPSVKTRRAELTAQKTQVTSELKSLQAEQQKIHDSHLNTLRNIR